jgi:membrane associated rhomboid family serine protease
MVLPLGDDNRDRTIFPWVTIGLIVINVLVFVLFQGLGNNDGFTYAFSTVPEEITSGRDLVTDDEVKTFETPAGPVQAKVPGLRKTPGSVYLTLLTSMFMHGGIAHLLGNMWFLWIFGDNIEQDLGRARYIAFYLISGLIASLTHVVFNWNSEIPSLGASGAISGVLGGYLLLHPHRSVTVLLFRFITQVPGWVAVGLWFAFQVINSLGVLGGEMSGVAYGAHIGGFIAGLALAKPFLIGRPVPKDKKSYRQFEEPPPHRDWRGW